MRVFVDTNVWLDVTLNRAGFTNASAFLLRCAVRNDDLWIAWHTISNMDYIHGRAKLSATQREQHLRDILQQARISPTDEADVLHALGLGWSDFEDALQFAAALRCKAEVIVTNNTKHFINSPILVLSVNQFLEKHP